MSRILQRCLMFALVLSAVPTFGQLTRSSDRSANATFIADPNTYGTLSETSTTISAWEFELYQQDVTWSRSGFNRYVTDNSGCCLMAGVHLPNGAVITGFAVDGCDLSTAGEIYALFLSCSGGSCTYVVQSILTGDPEAPGCALFRVNLNPPLIVNNATTNYLFEFSNPDDLGGSVSFEAARVFYKLQVSPPPNTATFNDVPTTHLFCQYIEALAAAGVTAGCGGGNFCPDAPLTRGAMAVFLAKALGLHWPG